MEPLYSKAPPVFTLCVLLLLFHLKVKQKIIRSAPLMKDCIYLPPQARKKNLHLENPYIYNNAKDSCVFQEFF
jgi:hypothetical protein